MVFVCKGYDGAMTEADWARMAQLVGGVPTVLDKDHLKVKAAIAGDRVNVSTTPGTAWAHGVMAESKSVETASIQFVRELHFDYVVLKRNWDNNSAYLEVVKGGDRERARDVLANNPGSKHQQLLATLAYSPEGLEVMDRRAFAGRVAYADSTAAVPAPHLGDTIITPNGTAWLWNGGTWTAPTTRIESGYKAAQFAGSTVYSYQIDYDRPFSTPPRVIASMATGAGGTQAIQARAYNITTRGFALAFITADGSKRSGVKAEANWIAVGV